MEIERRSKLRRSPRASIAGPAPTFDPTSEGWAEIETAYKCKHQFNDKERKKIRAIINKYFDLRRFEQAAALSSDIIAEVENTFQAAQQVYIRLIQLAGNDEPNKAARLDAILAIKNEWPAGAGEFDPIKIINVNYALVRACKRATKKLMKMTKETPNPGLRIGAAWDEMIIELVRLLEKIGLKVSVNKGQRSEEIFNLSPFVEFVKAIEAQYPSGIPKRSGSDHGLSDALSEIIPRHPKRGEESAIR